MRFARKALGKCRQWMLLARRKMARRIVGGLHRALRRDSSRLSLFLRALLFVYFVKRTLQEAILRGWPMTRLRRNRWRREVETAFAMKLLHLAHDRFDLPADACALHRFNNRVTDADRRAMVEAASRWGKQPLVGVLVPVYNARPEWIDRLLASVVAQVYDRWELILVDDCSPNGDVWPTLQRWAERDGRIVLERSPCNQGVAAATNRAAELASAEILAFADHDDELTPDALWWLVEALQGADDVDLVYSDEEIVPASAPAYPMFKPDWSPELLASFNYICHLAMVRRTAFDAVGGMRLGFDGAQDHDLICRLSTMVRRVEHVPRILYRWHVGDDSMSRRVERKSGDISAAGGIAEKTKRVVQEHLDRLELDADAGVQFGWCIPRYRPTDRGKASIVICTKDNAACLRAAVESIESKTDYPNYEMLIVDTGAETYEAQALLDELATRLRVLKYEEAGERFNWSRANNWAVEQSDGDVVVLLNDDVEVLDSGWLSALVAAALQPQVGAVGALLEYPDGRIQHAGVIVGAHGWGPWHVLMGFQLARPTDYQGVAYYQRNCLAVTGACLAIRRRLFREYGGLDRTKLAVGFSDVDLCVRLHKRGYRNVYVPQARLIHKEGQSRGMRIDPTEAAELASRTGGGVDPYWNPNFTRECHFPAVSSRRRPFGLRFPNGPKTLLVHGLESPDDAPPIDVADVYESTGRFDRAVVSERLRKEGFDVLVGVGWDAAPAIEAAAEVGVPAVWQMPRRALLEERLSPKSFQQFARRWRTQRFAYQVVFDDVHSRACWQMGWPRNNSMVIERVVPAMADEEIKRLRSEARRGLSDNAIVVAVEDVQGEAETVDCLHEAVALLDESLQGRVVIVAQAHGTAEGGSVGLGSIMLFDPVPNSPLATRHSPLIPDLFICQPFSRPRSRAALTALALGVPIIGSRFMEHADLMHVGVTGLQIGELDPKSLATALAELLPDENRRREMGRQSRSWLASRASNEWVRTQWSAVLEEAAELRTSGAEGAVYGDPAVDADRSVSARLQGILTTAPNDRS